VRFGIGQPVTRKEDARFLTGRGRYVADIAAARAEGRCDDVVASPVIPAQAGIQGRQTPQRLL
jgi:carbon-monoxide dehydrogenase large subunit